MVVDGKRNDIGTTADGLCRSLPGPASAKRLGRRCADGQPVPGRRQSGAVRGTWRCSAMRASLCWSRRPIPAAGCSRTCGPPTAAALYQRVAAFVQQAAQRTQGDCGYGAVGAVVGATYPEQLAELRQAMPNTWFLVPGYGAQGAGAREVRDAFAADGLGAVVNNSRGIIFAYERREYQERFRDGQWQRAVEAATRAMIDQLRSETPAGRL